MRIIGKLVQAALIACLFQTWETREGGTRILHVATRDWVPKWLVRGLAARLPSELVKVQLKLWRSEGWIPEMTAKLPSGEIRRIGLPPTEVGRPWRDSH